MSLGGRCYDRGRQLARDSLFVTPRDPSLFLHLQWFSSLTPRASAAPATTAIILSSPGDHVDKSHLRLSFQDIGEPQADFRLSASLLRNAKFPCTRIQRADKKRPESSFRLLSKWFTQASLIAPATGGIPLFRRSKSRFSIRGSGASTQQREFQIDQRAKDRLSTTPSVFRHVKTTIASRQKHRDDKAFVNSRLRDKGLWSYDWRLPFQILKQHDLGGNLGTPASAAFRWHICSRKLKYHQVRADEIPRPTDWSPLALAIYVEDLTNSTVTRHMQRLFYAPKESHVAAVTIALNAVFNDVSLRRFLTVRAFNEAIRFFYKHTMISMGRAYIFLMKELQMDISTETFNIVLSHAAHRRDLHTFTSWLRTMVKRRVEPNSDTWTALVLAIDSKAVKLRIIGEMKKRGLMDYPITIRQIIGPLLTSELTSHLDSGQDIDDFLAQWDKRYSPKWFTVRTANQLCHILGERGLRKESLRILEVMKIRGVSANEATLDKLLAQCALYHDVEGAVHMLRLIYSEYAVQPSEGAYSTLFALTWRMRQPNCCKVIWQVACMNATVSYSMQETVMRSLVRNTPKVPQSREQVWMKTAGKLVVGVGLRTKRYRARLSSRIKITKRIATWARTGDERRRSLSMAKLVLARDLEGPLNYSFRGPFGELLGRALDMDKRWMADGSIGKSTLWKVQNTLSVNAVSKARPAIENEHKIGRASKPLGIYSSCGKPLIGNNHQIRSCEQ
ncbi:hypothetical protein MMC06_001587 [Schaereria dolodes]|nr:hypothetical protein [Schaereria dolodes]